MPGVSVIRGDFVRYAEYFTMAAGIGMLLAVPSPLLAARLWAGLFAKILGVIGGLLTIACMFAVWRLVPAYLAANLEMNRYARIAALCAVPTMVFSIAVLIASPMKGGMMRVYWTSASVLWLTCVGGPLAVGFLIIAALGGK